ncbi:hypothetical protein FACS189485_02260 [Spirochaetia bacterium]|nr:hypothetical protein FACS189485_02260 [Spirochaetia bacterium]
MNIIKNLAKPLIDLAQKNEPSSFMINDKLSLNLFSHSGLSKWIAGGTAGLLVHTASHEWLIYNSDTGAFQGDHAEAALYQLLCAYEQLLLGLISRINPADQNDAFREYRKFCDLPCKKSVIESLTHEPGIAILPADLDTDDTLINCAGIAVSTDGARRTGRPDDLFTMSTVAKPEDGEPAEFMKFMRWVTCEDGELLAWLLTACGVALFGHPTDRIINFYGGGSNGKGTLLRTLANVIGKYATTLPRSLVIKENGGQSRFDKEGLPGRRVAILYDLKADKGRLNLDELKSIAGNGDFVHVEPKGKKGYDCQLKCKLFLSSNDKIPIDSFGESEKRRFRLVPFNAHIDDKDEGIEARFIPEYGKILNLFIEYAVKYYANGRKMPPCKAIDMATADYFDSQDIIGQFLKDSEAFTKADYEPKTAFYTKFEEYCEFQQGIRRPMKAKSFTNELEKRRIFETVKKIDGKATRVFLRKVTRLQENLNFQLLSHERNLKETNMKFENSCNRVTETTKTGPYDSEEQRALWEAEGVF